MKFYHDLYVTEELQEKREDIIKKLKKKKCQMNVYVITLTENEANQLEFYDSLSLQQKVFGRHAPFIIGLAKGKSEAFRIVEQITQEVYDNTKGTDIRRYLLQRQREFEERKE